MRARLTSFTKDVLEKSISAVKSRPSKAGWLNSMEKEIDEQKALEELEKGYEEAEKLLK